MLLCPPYVYLPPSRIGSRSSPILLGAQDLSDRPGRALIRARYPGAMLVDVGCRHVIVGHSERRALYGETDALVAAKFRAAQAAGLVPILCVGETLAQREAGQTEARSRAASRRRARRGGRRRVRESRHRLRARVGDRHRTNRHARASAGSARVHPGHGRGAGCYNCDWLEHPLRWQRQRRERARTCLPWMTSTGVWWAARHSCGGVP